MTFRSSHLAFAARRWTPLLVLCGLGLVAWWLASSEPAGPRLLIREPTGIMGTGCRLVAISESPREAEAPEALEAAERVLRSLEGLFSTWLEASLVSHLNAAPAEEFIPLPDEVLEVLRQARRLNEETRGAFDVTIRPLIELWREAGRNGVEPVTSEIESARSASLWDHFDLGSGGVMKSMGSARIDVDGIAKGYAIDMALQQMQGSGMQGGMVEVGGDLRVFGMGSDRGAWMVAIQSPFRDGPWAQIEVTDRAVCSSGDYARYQEIDGRRFSHIIDPRTGWPVRTTAAVTVVAADAAICDAWATALSVLGPEGLELLPLAEGLEAMVVTGTADDHRVDATPGFSKMLLQADFELAPPV